MHQSIGKKNKFILYILLLIFLSTINNKFVFESRDNLLSISEINVKGLNIEEKKILDNKLNYLLNQNIFFIDKSLIEKNINDINFIDHAEVKKIYPSSLLIITKKAQIIATTIKDNTEYLIGSNGKFILDTNYNKKENLPIIFGDFKILDFLNLNSHLINQGFNPEKFKKFYYFKNKRWDIQIDKNLLVKLPREKTSEAIKKLKIILESMENSKYKVVDLRVPNQIILN